ncbi:MAG TPA: branched-chain amino acid ABC transporter permease [Chloroflexi bacterium]|jgi:branched-chain amino acid transport system permease protein|nr:branched-chain amino acid ABC transporter permease [Chloroflexota bacterium]HAL27312.1 branched-chain amino acid ABC transporter permease [Chloroflexota bacterium]
MSRPALARAAIVAVAWLALATFPEWSQFWESSRFATGIIRQILIFAIFASSLDLLVGYAGLPSLGHAAFFGGGAYAAAIAAQRLGTDELVVSLGAGILGAALLALAVGFLAVRAVGIFFLMLTLALAQMVFAIAFQATDLTGGSNGFSAVHRPILFGIDFNAAGNLYLLVCVTFLLVLLLLWRITTSSYGRALVGVRENERRMRALGYDTRTLKLSAFVLAGAIAGVAGALSSYEFRFVSPNDVALSTSVTGFVMVLIGGAGTLFGPVLGAAVVLLIERVLPSQLPAQTVLGIVFILFVVFARQGIAGALRRMVRA